MTDKPWTDFDRLREVDEQYDTQKEMAEELGCSSATVSKWLGKMEATTTKSRFERDDKCHFYDVCGNKSEGLGQNICDTCHTFIKKLQSGKIKADSMEELYREDNSKQQVLSV